MSPTVAKPAEHRFHEHEVLTPPVPPPYFDATPSSILSDTAELIKASEKLHDTIVQSIKPGAATFTNTILPMILEENKMLYERQLIEFYASVSPPADLRQAARSAKRLFAEFDARVSTRQDLYDLILAVSSKAENVDPESRRLMERLLLESKRHGLAIQPEHRERLHEVNKELERIESQYLEALQLPNDTGIWIGRKEFSGLPDRFHGEPRGGGVRLKVGGRMQLIDLLAFVRGHKLRERI